MKTLGLTRQLAAMLLAIVAVFGHGYSATAQTKAPGQYPTVDFFKLANFIYNPIDKFNPTPLPAVNTVPPEIRALNGQKIKIRGNSMAVDFSEGMMSEFILAVSQDVCGYGAIPRINEWIYVTMTGGKKAKVITGGDMWVNGTFTVKEELVKGRVVGLYSIVAENVIQ
jgi:hypothetical protein